MSTLTVVFVIAGQGYQPFEYHIPKRVLQNAGIKVITASNSSTGTATASDGSSDTVDIQLKDITTKYDGLYLVGGPGALENLDTPTMHTIIQQFAQENKPFGAICISPRILAHAGVLNDKKATGWDNDKELAGIFKEHHVTYVHKSVVTDGSVITATGPSAAEDYGKAIARLLLKKEHKHGHCSCK